MVAVRLPAALRAFAGSAGVVHIDLDLDLDLDLDGAGAGPGADVGALLDRLAVAYPDLERRVRDEQGRLRPHVNIFVGTVHIRELDQLATKLSDGNEVVILPAVSGG